MTTSFRRRTLAGIAASSLLDAAATAHAEGQIRIAQQFGIVYLLLDVAQEQKLIEKRAQAVGVDAKVEWLGDHWVNSAQIKKTAPKRSADF